MSVAQKRDGWSAESGGWLVRCVRRLGLLNCSGRKDRRRLVFTCYIEEEEQHSLRLCAIAYSFLVSKL
jgi:hypothetical protein